MVPLEHDALDTHSVLAICARRDCNCDVGGSIGQHTMQSVGSMSSCEIFFADRIWVVCILAPLLARKYTRQPHPANGRMALSMISVKCRAMTTKMVTI